MKSIRLKFFVGIDVCKEHLDVYIQKQDGKGELKRLDNSPSGIQKLLRILQPGDRVVMEATGTYHLACAKSLCSNGLTVIVLNPAQSHYYAKSKLFRNKTDKVDAALLSEMAKDESHRVYEPAEAHVEALQGFLRMHQDLVKQQTVKKVQIQVPGIQDFEREFYARELMRLNLAIKEVMVSMKAHIRAHPDLAFLSQQLQSVPGIGPVVAAVLLAHLPRTLKSSKAASAFVGLNPALRQSGNSPGTTRISKTGNPLIRKMLNNSAMAIVRSRNPLRDFYDRIRENGKTHKSALTALANKLVRISHAVIQSGAKFNPEKLQTS